VARLRNGGKTIKFVTKKMLFNLMIKKNNGNPIDTSIVVPIRGVA